MSARPVRRKQVRADRGKALEESAGMPIIPPIGMAGDLPTRVTVVPGSTSSLILAAGVEETSGRPVLIPFVDLKVAGVRMADMGPEMDEEAFETLLSETLPIENAVFLSFDMVRDVRVGLRQLADSSGDGIGIEPERLKLARVFANELAKNATSLSEVLDVLIAGAESLRSAAGEGDAPDPGGATNASISRRSEPSVPQRRGGKRATTK